MTRYEARDVIYSIINSGIVDEDLEDELTEIASCICENSFKECDDECLQYCKLDDCENVKHENKE